MNNIIWSDDASILYYIDVCWFNVHAYGQKVNKKKTKLGLGLI